MLAIYNGERVLQIDEKYAQFCQAPLIFIFFVKLHHSFAVMNGPLFQWKMKCVKSRLLRFGHNTTYYLEPKKRNCKRWEQTIKRGSSSPYTLTCEADFEPLTLFYWAPLNKQTRKNAAKLAINCCINSAYLCSGKYLFFKLQI